MVGVILVCEISNLVEYVLILVKVLSFGGNESKIYFKLFYEIKFLVFD